MQHPWDNSTIFYQQVKEVGINPHFEQHKRETRFAAPVAQRRWLNERQTGKSRR